MKIYKRPLTEKMKQIIYEGFKEYDIHSFGTSGMGEIVSFYFLDKQENIISAVVVRLTWGAIHIKYVWTHKNHRNKGYATQLMKAAFDFAKENNCPFAYLETMNFQAPKFYTKLGFKTEFKRDGYNFNNSLYYMKKDFNEQITTS